MRHPFATPAVLQIEVNGTAFYQLMRSGQLRIVSPRGEEVAVVHLTLPDETRAFWQWVGAEGELRLAAHLGSREQR